MAKVIEKPVPVCRDHFLLKIDIDTEISQPGQFANIKIGESTDPLLRRPFSLFDHYGKTIELIIRIAGKGTKFLNENTKPGEIDIIAPLGRGFTIVENKKVLLIGGGVGNAPLHYLAKTLKKKNNTTDYLFAARSADYIYKKDEYIAATDHFHVATDDGTEGRKGLAAEIAAQLIKESGYDRIYICGPTVMIKAAAELLKNSGTPFEVSLENYFGCGIGVCSGCAVETTAGLKRACVDGPVFNGREINWDSLFQ